jgi:hypothetical protein
VKLHQWVLIKQQLFVILEYVCFIAKTKRDIMTLYGSYPEELDRAVVFWEVECKVLDSQKVDKMSTKNLLIASILLFISHINPIYAQNMTPQVPFIERNICPFECCQYGKWIARSPIKAFNKEGDVSSISFSIRAGEEFTAISGNVHVIKPGIIIIEKSFDDLKKGTKVYVMSYRGEGEYDLWYNGKELDNTDDVWKHGSLKQSPEFIWWVAVINKEGKRGWLRFKNISGSGFQTEDKIEGSDSCN